MNHNQTRLLLLLLLPVILLPGSLRAEPSRTTTDPAPLFEQANQAYSRGDHLRAIELYETLRADHGVSAALFYNLGNSYARNNQPGRAILNYLRAKRLAPGNPDIRGNLQLVRKNRGLFQAEQPWHRRLSSLLTMNQWLLATAAALVLLTLLHILPFVIKVGRRSMITLSVMLLLSLLTAGTLAVSRGHEYTDGVVVAADAQLLISPFADASPRGKLQEGRVVHPIRRHGDFFLVTDHSGRSGWLHQDTFELIVSARRPGQKS